jgi:hypothetical protein
VATDQVRWLEIAVNHVLLMHKFEDWQYIQQQGDRIGFGHGLVEFFCQAIAHN